MSPAISLIRTMAEARDALAEVLELPDRTPQIILIMEKIMLCRTAETRRFITDSMDGLVHGGLAHMRQKRREALLGAEAGPTRKVDTELLRRQLRDAKEQRHEEDARKVAELESAAEGPEFEPIVIVPSDDELQDVEELGTQLDALRLASVALELFPDLKDGYETWRIARAIYLDEAAAREAMLGGARLTNEERGVQGGAAVEAFRRVLDGRRPAWLDAVPKIRALVDEHFAAIAPADGGATPDLLFTILVMSDQRADQLLRLLQEGNAPALEHLASLRTRLDQLLEFEAERAKQS
ncbi:MAG: hypothetical protein HY716_07310 [Planctomycetes bacterium]|nr:hypothetical protein [Planctomycetota bacterium]